MRIVKGTKLAKRESAADARRRIAHSFAGNAVLTILLVTLVVLFVLVQQRNLDLEKLLPHVSRKLGFKIGDSKISCNC